jgi:hypothetical protein
MLYRVHHAWAGFQLTTLLVIGTDGIDSYKSNYHTITTAACKILTIKDLQQTSLWSWRLSIAISPCQEAFLLAVIKSYKEKKRKSQFHKMLFYVLPLHLCLVDGYTMKVHCLQIWKNPAIYNRFQVVYIVKHYVFGLFFFFNSG